MEVSEQAVSNRYRPALKALDQLVESGGLAHARCPDQLGIAQLRSGRAVGLHVVTCWSGPGRAWEVGLGFAGLAE